MSKQIRWYYNASGKARLQWLDNGTWADYTSHPLVQPDTQLDRIDTSKGFRTAQHLLSLGYAYASTIRVTDNKS